MEVVGLAQVERPMFKKTTTATEDILTREELQEFKDLIKKTKNIELTDEEAWDQATRLVFLTEAYIKFKQGKGDI